MNKREKTLYTIILLILIIIIKLLNRLKKAFDFTT